MISIICGMRLRPLLRARYAVLELDTHPVHPAPETITAPKRKFLSLTRM